MDRRLGIVLVFATLGGLLVLTNWLATTINLENISQYILIVPIIAGIVGGIATPYDLQWLVTRSSLILALAGGAVIAILYFTLQTFQEQSASSIGEAIGGIIIIIVLLALIFGIGIGAVIFMILIGIGALIGGGIARQFTTAPIRSSSKARKKSK